MEQLQYFTPGDSFRSGYDRGREQARANRLRELTSAYLAAPQEQRQGFASQFAELDPDAGLSIENRAIEQQKIQRDADLNRARAQLAFGMKAQGPARDAIYQQIRPFAEQNFGLQLPDAADDSTFAALNSAFGGGQQGTGLTPSLQSLIWQRDQGILNPEQFKAAVMVQNRLEAGAAAPREQIVKRWDNERQMYVDEIVTVGGYSPIASPQPETQKPPPAMPQQGAPSANPEIDRLGRMLTEMEAAGVAPEIVQRIATQEMQSIGLPTGTGQAFDTGAAAPTASPAQPAPQPRPQSRVIGQSVPSYAEQTAQREAEAAAAARGGFTGEREISGGFDDARSLREEYAKRIAGSKDVVSAYSRVEDASRSPTAAGDLSMVYAYMKMLDPGSVVREGEFATAQNAAGIDGRIVSLYNNIISGQRLNPAQRQDFLRQAAALRDRAQSSIDNNSDYYESLADSFGLDPFTVTGRRSRNGEEAPPAAEDDVSDLLQIYGSKRP